MTLGTGLLVLGYPIAVVPILGLRGIFRHRRTGWFWAEELGTALIVAGWVVKDEPPAVAVNAAWGVGLAAAWVIAGRRRAAV